MWGDRFQVVVTTHLNTNHLHNHFVLNSVSYIDGMKYYNKRENYAEMRRISDELCREYGLKVLKEKPCGKYKIDYTSYYKNKVQKSNYHTRAKQDIDFAILQTDNYKEFEKLMIAMNYELIYRKAGSLSIRKAPYTRNIRIARAFGEDYTVESIKKRIKTEKGIKVPFPEIRTKKFYGHNSKIRIRKKATGIRALYLYYCYLLKIFPKTNTKQKAPVTISADVQKMRRISEEARLLSRNDIKTIQELSLYMNTLECEKEELEEERDKLYYENTKLSKEERQANYDKLSDIAGKIQFLKREIQMCDEIKERTPKIKKNIQELNEERNILKREEREKNEYGRR